MERYPDIKLRRLREIGWREWNPLGLVPPGQNDWRHLNIAEYDNHLLHVVCMLGKGGSVADATAYLQTAAAQYHPENARTRDDFHAADRTVQALIEYLKI